MLGSFSVRRAAQGHCLRSQRAWDAAHQSAYPVCRGPEINTQHYNKQVETQRAEAQQAVLEITNARRTNPTETWAGATEKLQVEKTTSRELSALEVCQLLVHRVLQKLLQYHSILLWKDNLPISALSDCFVTRLARLQFSMPACHSNGALSRDQEIENP